MRIFFASDTSPNARIQSNLWRCNLYEPLVDLGHEVIEFDYDLRQTFLHLDSTNPDNQAFIRENRPQVSQNLLQQIETAHRQQPIDLFFSYFYDACVLPEAIDAIRSLGIKTVNWYCNGSYQLHLVQEIAPHYDWCLVPEKFRLADYKAIGANPIYCQEAANPNVYQPKTFPQEFDVTFVGQAYGDRPAYIQHLLDAGIDVRVWGRGWNRFSRPRTNFLKKILQSPKSANKQAELCLPSDKLGDVLSDDEMIAMFSRSKINLGFSSCGNTAHNGERILQVRLRDFEVPMSGGFYMVEAMEELAEFFEIGKEIVCYENPADLVDKIRYYLQHEDEREAIRLAGHQRCLQEHTWHRRFQTAFEQMGLLEKSVTLTTSNNGIRLF